MNTTTMNMLEALEHFEGSDIEDYVHSLELHLAECPEDAKAHLLLGNTYYLQGKISQAIKALRRTLEINAQSPQAYYHLGVALYRSSRIEEALDALRRVTELAPNLAMAYYWLGIAYYHKGQYETSQQAFETLLARQPESKIAHYHAALACIAQRNFEGAQSHLEALIHFGDQDPQIFLLLGNALCRRNQISKAIETYKQGVAAHPNNLPLREALVELTEVDEP